MSTTTAPADSGQGAAAPASSAVLQSGAPPASTATSSSATVASSAPAPAPAPGASWLGEGADELTTGFVQNKGWDTPMKAVQSYQNLEKLLGADRAGNTVIIPKEGADPKDVGAFYDRLGRPADASGYKIAETQGGNQEFQTAALGKIHELGLSKTQGESLVNWFNEQGLAAQTQSEQAKAAAFTQDQKALETGWGAAYTQNLAQAQNAARALGLDNATIDKMSDALGHKGTLELLQKIGSKAIEADFVSGDSGNKFSNVLSPAQAKAEIQSLMSDKNFTAKYLSKNAEAVARMTQLHEWAAA